LIAFWATPTGSWNAGTATSTYQGYLDDRYDLLARVEIMKKAMAAAAGKAGPADPTVLKIFMAPEFYFRGTGGAYPVEMLSEILPALKAEAAQDKYADWVFIYGTALGYLKHQEGFSPVAPDKPYVPPPAPATQSHQLDVVKVQIG